MPPPLTRLRRTLGRLLAVRDDGHRPWGEGGGTQTLHVVPLTVRARTADAADLRMLLEVRLASPYPDLPDDDLERITLALVIPATSDWVRRHELTALDDALGPRLLTVEDAVRAPMLSLGAELLAVDVIACEHLLASPSAEPDQGGPDGLR
ncbi:hypothetical protein ABFU82_16365 [Nocardioides sp. WV_118_6]|uniref:hypothetical protein n=1 Tax=Pimelobacter TaxID=2044 RepID=UPI001C0515BA|nr:MULTISPECIES: hypothetical protein [Pimelobacter]UUW90264.1 hypothetical protein M0M43_01915 [Pimelobacter simplex]UUW94093.1 hypothetical protein M0M48_20425 [Pimelobacter simplex]